MGYKYKPNCSVCQVTKVDRSLEVRIYNAAYKRDDDDETLNDVRKEYHLTSPSMYNHVKKHVPEAKKSLVVQNEKKIALAKAKIAKELELSFEHDAVVPKEEYEVAMDEVISKGLLDMKGTGKHVSVNQLIAMVKVKADYQSKRRGQDVEVLKTVYQTMKEKSGKEEVRTSS